MGSHRRPDPRSRRLGGESGQYILGENVEAFEQALADLWSRRFAIGVASGLDALEISLRVLECGPGSYVLTTPLSAFATTLAIVRVGAVPVFVDTDSSGGVDLALCRESLAPARKSASSCRSTSMATRSIWRRCGNCARNPAFSSSKTAPNPSWPLPPESSRRTYGELAATSFYPTKNLGAMGHGGAILTDREEFAVRARILRNSGQSARYRHHELGYNSHLDELHAAILTVPSCRNSAAGPPAAAPCCTLPRRHPQHTPGLPGCAARSASVYHLFPTRSAEGAKAAFLAYLRARDILCGEHYPIVIPDQPALRGAAWQSLCLSRMPSASPAIRGQPPRPSLPYG